MIPYHSIIPRGKPSDVGPSWPWEAAEAGMAAAGFTLVDELRPASILLTWSPWEDSLRKHHAQKHTVVIVMENGWLSPIFDVPYYQVALRDWNGGGIQSAMRDTEYKSRMRWVDMIWRLGAERPPVYDPTGHILLIEQRKNQSEDQRVMPKNWIEKTINALPENIPFRIRCRSSMKNMPLAKDLDGCRGVLTWTSTVASWAIYWRIPVAYQGPIIMLHEYATRWFGVGEPKWKATGLIDPMRYAFTQWGTEELVSGRPFKRLLLNEDLDHAHG